jgi:hypothetical protein
MAYGRNRKVGGSTSGRIEKTPATLKRERSKRKREEARWQRLNGPVRVRKPDIPSGDSA